MSFSKLRSGIGMNSLEAVLELIIEAESLNRNDSRLCFLRRKIEKDLEILEILKKHVYFSVKSRCIRMGDIYKRTTSFDYEDLKEWLRNAK